MPANLTVLESFELFFSEDFVTRIAQQTNLFYNNKRDQAPQNRKTWTDVTINELYCFIAVSYLMAQVKKLKIVDYWSTDALLVTPIFGQVFSRDRFLSILWALHFSEESQNENDKLHKIRLVVDHLKKVYQNTFYPFENLCIDESLMLFKGRLSFKQYIPSKRHRFGIKLFVLCDCETGYILDFIIYCGATSDIQEYDTQLGKSGNIVFTLMQPYLGSGHTLYTDNWYTSPILYGMLYARQTNACGTVKQNRKNMPDMKEKISRGQVIHFSTDNILALKWQDKREVRMLTTLHTADMVHTGKKDPVKKTDISKPKCIVDYNTNMGAVDRTDMLQSSIQSVRKSVKWYKKLFFHLLDMTLLNSHAVYKMKTGENIPVADFQLKLVKELLAKYKISKPRSTSRKAPDTDSPLRLTERHFISQFSKDQGTNKQPRKRCVVCSKKNIRKETTYCCPSCDVPLCVIPCFKNYHTLVAYGK